jgi:hypothetical protein
MPRKNATSERLDKLEERLSRFEEVFGWVSEAPPSSSWARLLVLRRHFVPLFYWFAHGAYSGKGALTETGELAVEPWKHLVRRPHPWRKQLYLRGRNMTARQLVGGIQANNLDEEKASANYKAPVEAIREALAYVEQNKTLLEAEAEIERLMLKREGIWGRPLRTWLMKSSGLRTMPSPPRSVSLDELAAIFRLTL